MKHLSKILWIICAVLLVGAIIFIFGRQVNDEQTNGITNLKNITFPQILFVKHPVRNEASQDPKIYAKAFYLVDLASFYPMYSQNENEKLPIASTTKIMTALVVLENHGNNLEDTVTITPTMINVEGSDIQLRSGEKITVENLLNGLLIMSGNDTAYALAEHFGGKDDFVKEMNEKAQTIGAVNTMYKDPAGLNDEGYSTAHDLAIIAAYALRNKEFAEIVRTSNKTISDTSGAIVHELKNSNRMLREEEIYYYPYAIGVKTGFTNEAGHVLVSAAEKDDHKILSVVLNTEENSLTASAKESKKLLEWGFGNWQW